MGHHSCHLICGKLVNVGVENKMKRFQKPRKVIFVEELPHEKDVMDREAVKAKWGE